MSEPSIEQGTDEVEPGRRPPGDVAGEQTTEPEDGTPDEAGEGRPAADDDGTQTL